MGVGRVLWLCTGIPLVLIRVEIWLLRNVHAFTMLAGGLQAWYAHEFRRGGVLAKAWYIIPYWVCRYSWLPFWWIDGVLIRRQLARERALGIR